MQVKNYVFFLTRIRNALQQNAKSFFTLLSIRLKGKHIRNYVEYTLKEKSRFPKEILNHFDIHNEWTNKRFEGDTNKMKLFCVAADPLIDNHIFKTLLPFNHHQT